jgi:hypothetical protein
MTTVLVPADPPVLGARAARRLLDLLVALAEREPTDDQDGPP